MAGMKSTKVDPDGTVRCPKCGATSFVNKRSIKGKLAGGLLAPKRLKCNGCGTMLKAS
jgi:ribosomal protein S27E